ncbi:MAG: chemotaxis response regulator protein-glutamate methylesterase [Acidobacteria bacterium]|nr:chemotaxis response regulator protein-glutamate methylesterase [Acidobacteriota bacterium]
MKPPVSVLIVDDSALVRGALSEILGSDPRLSVLPPASDPFVAAARIQERIPDVIVLDVEMPRMDGITFLKRLMSQHPIPVVLCSGAAESGSRVALDALDAGAVEVMAKPRLGTRQFFEESRDTICDIVYAASQVPVKTRRAAAPVAAKLNADAVLAKTRSTRVAALSDPIFVVGASTGGTDALVTLLSGLPADLPGMVIVQHMPEFFTASFADRLDRLSALSVKEAAAGDEIQHGQVLLARGNRHLVLLRKQNRYVVDLLDGPPVSRHRPSVDVLFRSAAQQAGRNAVGVILTGMGDDGAAGMLELKQAGARTFAQDKDSCVVFGMPNEAIKRGGVERILPLTRIAPALIQLAREMKA